MNERIQELAEESGLYQQLAASAPYPSAVSVDDFAHKKFAKMIIQECVEVASKYDQPKMSGPGLMIGQMIAEHFGGEQ